MYSVPCVKDSSQSSAANDCGRAVFLTMCLEIAYFRYMPPERMTQGKLGPEGDLWAAGMVVAELLTQRVPFASCDTHVSVGYRHHTSLYGMV